MFVSSGVSLSFAKSSAFTDLSKHLGVIEANGTFASPSVLTGTSTISGSSSPNVNFTV